MDPNLSMGAGKVLIPLLVVMTSLFSTTRAAAQEDWQTALQERLAAADAAFPGDVGVFVKDLRTQQSVSFRAEESWYIASVIKVPVAVEVMRRVEAGELSLDDEVTLRPTDYVDGAGQTHWEPAGTRFPVRHLMDRMLTVSDNTATDMLIRLVGLEAVNRLARDWGEDGMGEITTLADVRRHAYSTFHPRAFELTGANLLQLRQQPIGAKRVQALADILGVKKSEFGMPDLDRAFAAYYATNLNAATLHAVGRMLEKLAWGDSLAERESTSHVLGVMRNVVTGQKRIKAALPKGYVFAHKTGTQYARTCDAGIIHPIGEDAAKGVIVAACTRGGPSTARAEKALRGVGKAVRESGVLMR